MHSKVPQAIIDSLGKEAIILTPEEVGEMWELIYQHMDLEKETIQLAEKGLKNCRLFPQRRLSIYLREDERKHDCLLVHLENFKRKLYSYA